VSEQCATYHIIPRPTDPQVLQVCEKLFHHAISAKEAAALIEEIMHRRWLEWQAGWTIVDSGNGWICYAQEDELIREEIEADAQEL
jgi:hypothetical protein